MLTRTLAAAFAIAGATLAGNGRLQAPDSRQPPDRAAARVIAPEQHDVSRPLREIPPIPPAPTLRPEAREPVSRHRGRGPRGVGVDTVVQSSPGLSPAPAPSQTFEGVGNVNGVLPPDSNGDVGPNHYVQWVNLSFAIYSKGAPGVAPALIYGPAAGSTLWAGFGGPCESTNNGDPIVLYDHLADRWIMSQLSLPNAFLGIIMGPFYQCIAVSATGDPTGAYYRYQYSFDKLNDYPKLGVWPDAYYMTVNQFTAISLQYAGQGVVAFDRASMLAGKAARMIYIDLGPVDLNLGGMLPADLDGPPPPGGSPGYFAQIDDDAWGYSGDQVQLWRFHTDWAQPSASTFTRAALLATEPFDSDLCGYSRNCIPQPGTSAKIDAIADRLMYRLQYRNFGDHESLVANHTVDVDGSDHAGIRWYEIRDPHGTPFFYQQGTYAPDGDHRWMASAAMDGTGNLAIGYSVSSASTPPSIRYAGRLVGDAPGILTQAETSLVAGSGAQTDSSGRWGDYSMMAVDPADDCTFWYTQEYYTATSGSGWHTRIGAFSFPSCVSSAEPGVTVAATATPANEAGPVPGAFTVTRPGDTSQPLTVQYSVTGSATPDVDYVALPGTVTIPAGAASAIITVTPIDDTLFEDDETVVVTLSLDPAYHIGAPASAVVIIASDDLPPDLVVTATTAPSKSGSGQTISVGDTVKNQGTGPAGASVTALYLSTDTTFDAADVLLGTRAVPSLAAGATSAGSTSVQIPASTATGTYYVLAKADGNGDVVENVETNNVKASTAVQLGPDLIITAFTAPSTAAAGGTVTVSATTTNQGGGTAQPSATKFYLSAGIFLDASAPVIGSRAVPSLDPGSTDTAQVSLTIPPSTTPGQYYFVAKADADGVVAETQESNNARLGVSVKIGPDLTMASVSAPATAGAGAPLTITDKTANTGGAAAGASTTSFYLSTNLSLDASDPLLGSRGVPALDAGTSSTASTSVQIPAGTTPGTYYLLAKADSGNAVAESVETNNVSYATAVRIGPDLVVSSLSAPSSSGAGATLTVTDTTKNQGGSTSPSSITVFYLSTNGSLDSADVVIGQRAVPELAAGTSSSASTSVQIPAGTATAAYYIIAKADGPDTVVESNETNNVSFAAAIRIGPDLTASGVTVTSSAASITINDTTSNPGGAPAPASTTYLFLSSNQTLDAADVLIGSRAVPPLNPVTSSTGATVTQIPAGTPTGTYYVFAKADGPDAILESVETNNVSSAAILRIGPDLTISSLVVPSSATAGGSFTVTDTTANQGTAPAPGSTTRFYLSTNLFFDASDVLLGSRVVPALAPVTSDTASTTLAIPAGTTPTAYYVLAIADGDATVVETVETNNTRAVYIRVY